MNINWAINLITSFSVLIPFSIGLFAFSRLKEPYKLLFLLALSGVLAESINWLLPNPLTKKWVLNLYTLTETIFITLMYHRLISSEKWKKNILRSLAVFCLFLICNMLFIQGMNTINSISMVVECIYLIVLSACLFNQLIVDVPSTSLLRHEMFWFNIGVFSYFSVNFFTFLMSNTIYSNTNNDFHGFHLWHIHNVINVFFNLSFSIALWLAARRKV